MVRVLVAGALATCCMAPIDRASAQDRLHHPLRAESAVQYIPESLGMLEEIQRTGDIFFPKRWMDATLSGHNSSSAAHLVRTFLAGLPPTYPDRLPADHPVFG